MKFEDVARQKKKKKADAGGCSGLTGLLVTEASR